MSGSEDGQLRSPADVNMFSYNGFDEDQAIDSHKIESINNKRDTVPPALPNVYGGDEDHDTDSLDIKPPQAQVTRETSGSRRKDRSKDKKHSKERRHKERDRYSDLGPGREKEKDYRDERQERRSDVDRKEMKRVAYEREEYIAASSEKRYHKHYDHMGVGGGENISRSRTVYHHDAGGGVGSGASYHHEHQYHQYHMHQQQRQHQQEYYEHRRQEYHHHHHHPTPTDYHQQQQRHHPTYENARAMAAGGHKHYDQRKYYEPAKDPESLEQDLRSRLLSKRHKYVKDDVMEVEEVFERPAERIYEERDPKSSKSERHKARRKERENLIDYYEDDAEVEHQRRRKKHKRHKDKHNKRYLEEETAGEPSKSDIDAEKNVSPEDAELVARRSKLLAADLEKDKRKETARKELEARREILKERSVSVVNALSPTAVAASVTASLHIIKRKHNEKEEKKSKRKRLKNTKNMEEDHDDVEEDEDEEDSETDSSDDFQESEDENKSQSDEEESDHSAYKKSKSKNKKNSVGHLSDGEISAPESPLSVEVIGNSPTNSKRKSKKARSETISLSPSSVDSLSRSQSPAESHSRSRSRSKSYRSITSRSAGSRTSSHSSGHSRSRSRSSSRSRTHSRTSRSHSISKSRSRSSSRSRSEERDMKVHSQREEKENRDKPSLNDGDRKKPDGQGELSIMDDKGNPLPNYYPGIQGCRSVEEFQCLNRIEEGTYGVVYRAKDKRTNEIVALKRLKMEKEKEGFPITSLREINTLLKGQHPNIVTVREIVVGSNMDKIFIVMDYVEHDLKSLMETMKAKKQFFLPGEIKCLTQQLLRAVGHLHDNWILHRDLKTSNLLLSHKGILKVGDFGLAREYGSPLKNYTSLVVTLWYRAPELLLCSPEYSTPIDIWSVGCIYAEFLQMAPIFPGKTEVDELNKIFKELGTPNEKIWPGYNDLPAVKNMLSQNSQFADYPVSSLRKHFADKTSDLGIDLLQGLLTYDPKQRLTADGALKHQYFKELPVPIDPSMFPTWPAKSELGARKALASSPKPPSGGSQFKQLGRDDAAGAGAGGGSGSKIISGIITGNKKSSASANTGFVLNAGIEQRQLAMGPGFNLKF